MRSWSAAAALAALPALSPATAHAHVFAQPYTLPVPFAVYAYAASAALLVSFLIAGLFVAAPKFGAVARHESQARDGDAPAPAPSPWILAGQALGVALLLLCIATGLAGNQNVFMNFNMTFFWIGFVLAVPYAVAVIGDFYAPLNPWRSLVALAESAAGAPFRGIVRYPVRLGYVPGLVLYMAFIWLELFGQLQPRGLSVALAIYTLVNLAGAFVFGTRPWFEHGEFFGIFLRLLGAMSVRARAWGSARRGGARWRAPFVGLLDPPAGDLSLVLFILFMLSSTAFDGLHSTLPWVSLFWKHLYPGIASWLGSTPAAQFQMSTKVYYLWQWLALLASPFLYLMIYAASMWVLRRMMRTSTSVRELMLRFAMSLVPIAFVYHLTHYYTLLFSQGGQIVRLASDPFGLGWDLLGTARRPVVPVMLDVGNIWLTQVALILAGHIVAVYLAHLEALRLFATPRRAALSQLPMLLLMVAFTNLGLWILSLPIAG